VGALPAEILGKVLARVGTLFEQILPEGAEAFRPLNAGSNNQWLQPRGFCCEQGPGLKALSI
jgi:hypothetical protein